MKISKIKEQAQKIIKEHKVKTVFATSDGQIFLPSKKQAANFHAKQNGGLKIYTIEAEAKKEIKKEIKKETPKS